MVSVKGRGRPARIVGRGQINMLKMNIQFISLASGKKTHTHTDRARLTKSMNELTTQKER